MSVQYYLPAVFDDLLTLRTTVLKAKGALNEPALRDLEAVMRDSSICGLGQAAPNPLTCVLRYFRDDLAKPLGKW